MLARTLVFALLLATLRLVFTLEDALVSSTGTNDAGVALDGDATTECRTQTKSDFEGVRMKGTSGAERTIGTQSSQSASST